MDAVTAVRYVNSAIFREELAANIRERAPDQAVYAASSDV